MSSGLFARTSWRRICSKARVNSAVFYEMDLEGFVMLEVKPITSRETFVQPVQAVSVAAKEAHHMVGPAATVTISAAAAALSTNNKPKAAKDQGEEDPRKSFRKKLDDILARILKNEKELDSL